MPCRPRSSGWRSRRRAAAGLAAGRPLRRDQTAAQVMSPSSRPRIRSATVWPRCRQQQDRQRRCAVANAQHVEARTVRQRYREPQRRTAMSPARPGRPARFLQLPRRYREDPNLPPRDRSAGGVIDDQNPRFDHSCGLACPFLPDCQSELKPLIGLSSLSSTCVRCPIIPANAQGARPCDR